MQCNFCNKEATIFYTTIINGVQKSMKLCESCAEERGITDVNELAAGHELMGLPKGEISLPAAEKMAAKAAQSVPMEDGAECPNCGFALEDLKRVGRLGCSQCYSTFRGEIEGVLRNMHVGGQHHGRVPDGLEEAIELDEKLDELKTAINQAIANEDYEKAAELRDEIKQLEKKSDAPVKKKAAKKAAKKASKKGKGGTQK